MSELKQESWTNKPKPETVAFNQEAIQKVEDSLAILETHSNGGSKYFKINDGEDIEVYFDMNDPLTGVRMGKRKDWKTGNFVEKELMHFLLWNDKEQCNQLWTPADMWAKGALQAMKDFGPGLVIRCRGKEKGKQITFMPTGFKRAM